jgi:AcrR family transcriptional regulator
MPTALTDVDLAGLQIRVLHAFAERASTGGLRSVVVSDLARDVGISTKTIYRCFETKDQMVESLIQRWIERLFADSQTHRPESRGDALDALRRWGEAWVRGIQRFSPAFWSELERDHPRAYASYVDAVRKLRNEARENFTSDVRPDVSVPFAQSMFLSMVRTAADPAFSARSGMTRRDAVLAAIDLWAMGALATANTQTRRTPEGGHQ